MDAYTLPPLRGFQNHSLDSTRWAHYVPRDGDIVVSSSYKSGTTWLQLVLLRLVMPDVDLVPVMRVSPWLESPLVPLAEVLETLDLQSHRRVIKTHLPLDGLPYHAHVKYIVVARDPRDVFMSLWNHYQHLIRYPFQRQLKHPERVGGPLPACPDDLRVFWRSWMTRGWFEWESEGYPFWANLRHSQVWWQARHLPNVAFVHFNDLLTNLDMEIESIASYLGVAVDRRQIAVIAEGVQFSRMREHDDVLLPDAGAMLRGGGRTFMHQGTNGRWKEWLSADDLSLYAAAVARELSPACAEWLEHGRAFAR